MSKGSPVVPVRIPAELLEQVNAAVEEINIRRIDEPLTRNGWIVRAMKDALAKRKRSATRKRKGTSSPLG